VIRNLRAELQDNRAKARKKYPIDLAWTDWQDAMVGAGFKGKAKCKLSNDRIDAMAGIFEAGYTLADFKLAILGLAANPYVIYGKRRPNGNADDVEVDLTYVCKEAKRFEEAARLGFVIEHARKVRARHARRAVSEHQRRAGVRLRRQGGADDRASRSHAGELPPGEPARDVPGVPPALRP
jgi:hypothetical protein